MQQNNTGAGEYMDLHKKEYIEIHGKRYKIETDENGEPNILVTQDDDADMDVRLIFSNEYDPSISENLIRMLSDIFLKNYFHTDA